jgi:hypothetical protein
MAAKCVFRGITTSLLAFLLVSCARASSSHLRGSSSSSSSSRTSSRTRPPKRGGDWRTPEPLFKRDNQHYQHLLLQQPLALKGGGGAAVASSDDEDKEKLPEYTGEGDTVRGQALDGVFALDAVEIRMLLADKGANTWRGEGFRPMFAHQIFGQEEEIVGYKRPRVSVTYSADTLLPCIEFQHSGIIGGAASKESRTDVGKCIKKAAPSDYINATRLPAHVAATAGIFRPPGRRIADYTLYELGGSEADVNRAAFECGGETVRYEVYAIKCGDGQGEAAQKLVKRTQSLAMWLIEEASYIDHTDPNWTCLMIYERVRDLP